MNPTNPLINSFSPISDSLAEVLILGSMPGIKSLEAKQYYAHKQNAFWKVMGAVCGFNPLVSYEQRVAHLQQHRIAVWDVLYSCEREGSLDSAITNFTVNNFEEFFNHHPHIQRICFNGAATERYFKTYVMPNLNLPHLMYVRLPSTSPAHASMALPQKILAWKAGLGLL